VRAKLESFSAGASGIFPSAEARTPAPCRRQGAPQMRGEFLLAQYMLTERIYWDLRLYEPGEVIQVPDDTIPGRSWVPYGPGPYREYEYRPPRTAETERD
jgi:hypothetical protein